MLPSSVSIPSFETPRLRLRPFDATDGRIVQRLAGAPEVALTTKNIPHPYRDGLAEEWIASHKPAWEERRILTLAMTSDRDGLVGAVGLRITTAHRRGELGYWVGHPFWNQGYATEASAALVEFGFNELGMNRIQARHLTRNPSSGRVMEKLGMQFEGIQRQCVLVRGTPEDLAMYAILRTDRRVTGTQAS